MLAFCNSGCHRVESHTSPPARLSWRPKFDKRSLHRIQGSRTRSCNHSINHSLIGFVASTHCGTTRVTFRLTKLIHSTPSLTTNLFLHGSVCVVRETPSSPCILLPERSFPSPVHSVSLGIVHTSDTSTDPSVIIVICYPPSFIFHLLHLYCATFRSKLIHLLLSKTFFSFSSSSSSSSLSVFLALQYLVLCGTT